MEGKLVLNAEEKEGWLPEVTGVTRHLQRLRLISRGTWCIQLLTLGIYIFIITSIPITNASRCSRSPFSLFCSCLLCGIAIWWWCEVLSLRIMSLRSGKLVCIREVNFAQKQVTINSHSGNKHSTIGLPPNKPFKQIFIMWKVFSNYWNAAYIWEQCRYVEILFNSTKERTTSVFGLEIKLNITVLLKSISLLFLYLEQITYLIWCMQRLYCNRRMFTSWLNLLWC